MVRGPMDGSVDTRKERYAVDGWMREGRKDGKKEGRMCRWEGQVDRLTTGFPPSDSVTRSLLLHRLLDRKSVV